MTRRILLAILGVTVLAVLAFGVPLAIAVRQVEVSDAISSLQRDAVRVAAEVPQDLHGGETIHLPRQTDPDNVRFAVYDASGDRVAGRGPKRADKVVKAALTGRLAHYGDASAISVGWPLTANERTYGAVRASVPESSVEDRVRTAWALMALLGGVVVAAAAFAAWRVARRLAGPVDDLAGAVMQLGRQDFTVRVEPSGVPELDRAGEAVDVTAARLGRMIARERSFSADVSHQLRTPLTGLRLVLESAEASEADPRPQLDHALAQVDRLESTIDDLLRLAREDRPTSSATDVGAVLQEVIGTWRTAAVQQSRPLDVQLRPDLPEARMSAAALRQIVEVLLANAMDHGEGRITVTAGPTPGGVSVEVSDEGPGSTLGLDQVFERGTGTGSGHGIGLALARSLAEAEGGRLTLRATGPNPVFRLLIPA